MKKIGAVIVTYNPNILILIKNIEALVPQVDKIIVVDNNSENYKSIENLIGKKEKIKIIRNSENKGIATALNQGIKELEILGYYWVITLDQDSILSKGSIAKMENYCQTNVGIICPRINYNNYYIQKVSEEEIEEIKACMTSASLTNILAWKKVRGFDESFFIDYVDNDFCMKLKLKGYSILRVNNCILEHNLGESGSFRIFNRKLYYFRHNPIRCYYIIRNIIIFNRRYKDYINYYKETLKVLYLFINCLLFCKPRIKTLNYLTRGVLDGISQKSGPFLDKKDL